MRRRIVSALLVLVTSVIVPTSAGSPVSARTPAAAPRPPGVLFILLDEASLWSLVRPDGTINANRFPGFAALAAESTWYRDTLSTAQWTWFAAPSLLTGREADFTRKPTGAAWPRNLFTALAGPFEMDVQEPVTTLCPKKVCARPMQSSKGMRPRDHVLRLYDTVNRAASATTPGLHFVHSLVPHRPWLLTPEMRISANEMADPRPRTDVDRKRDVYQGHLRQYVAADTAIGDMVRNMKASPNWDDTMIVVTSDHALTFRPGSDLRTKIEPEKKAATDEVFRVPLFIKYPRQNGGTTSDCVASTMDILPTILSVTGVKKNWKLDGVDLTRKCPRQRIRPIHWPEGSGTLNTGFKDVLRSVAFYDKWIDAEGGVDDIARTGLGGSLVGTTVPTTAGTDERVEWRLHRPRDFQTIGEGRFAAAPGRATGTIRATADIDGRTEGLIVLDGTIVGVMGELAGRKKSPDWEFFSSCMMTSALRPGPHTVELWTARWSAGKATLRRVGPPVS